MKTLAFNENDDWSDNGPKINSTENLAKIQEALNKKGSLIVQHWHYCGATCPTRQIFDDYEEFMDYLNTKCFAGDIIDTWLMHELCTPKNLLVSAKCPDEHGRVPENGAY